MQTFNDTTGQSWLVEINILAVKNVKKYLGLDLLQPKVALAQIVDPISLCDMLYVICRDQAEERGLTDEDFGRLLGGTAIQEGRDAFVEAYINFTPNPKSREALRVMIEKAKSASDRMHGILERNMAGFDLKIDLAVEEFEKEMRKEMQKEPGTPFSTSQEV